MNDDLVKMLNIHVEGVRHYLHLQIGKPLSKDLVSAPEIALDNLQREIGAALRETPAQGWERCPHCDGKGLALNNAGEPDECKECKGNTVVAAPPATHAALRDALKNMLGVFDTPVARRRYPPDDFMREAIESARAALQPEAPARAQTRLCSCKASARDGRHMAWCPSLDDRPDAPAPRADALLRSSGPAEKSDSGTWTAGIDAMRSYPLQDTQWHLHAIEFHHKVREEAEALRDRWLATAARHCGQMSEQSLCPCGTGSEACPDDDGRPLCARTHTEGK